VCLVQGVAPRHRDQLPARGWRVHVLRLRVSVPEPRAGIPKGVRVSSVESCRPSVPTSFCKWQGFRGSDSGFRDSDSGIRASDSGIGLPASDSGLWVRVSGFGSRFLVFEFRVPNSNLGFRTQFPGFEFWVPSFGVGFQILGSRYRSRNFGFRGSGGYPWQPSTRAPRAQSVLRTASALQPACASYLIRIYGSVCGFTDHSSDLLRIYGSAFGFTSDQQIRGSDLRTSGSDLRISVQ
jgi:hypothetical protein